MAWRRPPRRDTSRVSALKARSGLKTGILWTHCPKDRYRPLLQSHTTAYRISWVAYPPGLRVAKDTQYTSADMSRVPVLPNRFLSAASCQTRSRGCPGYTSSGVVASQ
ncbi:conserved hypothetical protein [Trichinella spiralis]|uniref:hypothetical protein n=1 Tax=Trichinella spiralis TaxID=6334 RepID=UPI0001EFC2BC|nr:conserved hypothetical protein [Trichinella spiralis]